MLSIHDMVTGNTLSDADRARVLNSFPYRMTYESVKRWPDAARTMYVGGYRLPLISDVEWLTLTLFKVTKAGRLDKRSRYCQTNRRG